MSGKFSLPAVADLVKQAAKRLKPKKIVCDADRNLGYLEAEILLGHVLKKDRVWIMTHEEDRLSPSLADRYERLVRRRLAHEPIAYIVGKKEFYGRTFAVDRTVLIPRPETELVIDTMKERFRREDAFFAWDVGTGSGAIAVTLALEFPSAAIVASDASAAALKTARKNAAAHGASARIAFLRGDLLAPRIARAIATDRPLAIAANLPYLPERDRGTLAADVTEFEPTSALFAGPDGLETIRKLFAQIADALDVNPALVLAEFDPPQAKTIRALAETAFPLAEIRVRKDLAERDRLLEIAF